MVQLTVITFQDYSSWTHDLGVDREHILQILQSSVYAFAQNLFAEKEGIVFQARCDQLYAITNKITAKDHIEIYKAMTSRFPIPLEITIAFDKSPFKANETAFGVSRFCPMPECHNVKGSTSGEEEPIYLIHADIEGLTEASKRMSYFETHLMVQKTHQKILEFFQQCNSLAFYMGGDNFMIVSDEFARQHAKEFITYAKETLGIFVNCGIGIESTGRKAAMYATASLDMIRARRSKQKTYPRMLCIQDESVKQIAI